MNGETNLDVLLKSMQPAMKDGEFVFVSLPHSNYGDYTQLKPIAMFHEEEGISLVIPQSGAQLAGLPYDSIFKCITLTVHSSLDAVGLTAAFATKLAEHNISANVIAGYYHDHIFVQVQHAETALIALQEFSN